MQILELYLQDNVKARELKEDGLYHRIKASEGQEDLNVQK